MPEKAEKAVIESGLRDTNLVQMSRPLSLMTSIPFSLGELKVLDVYLSRIDSHDPKHCTVTFTKAEYEKLMGIEKTNMATLRKYTSNLLCNKVVDIPMKDGYLQFVLFTGCRVRKDEYGVQVIELSCSEQAKALFFEIDKLGYLRYRLKYMLSLTHKSSRQLYLEVLRERYRETWTVPIERLRDYVFDLKKQDSYKVFKDFRRYVLEPAVKELNKKTDVMVSYETEKRGKVVTAITFTYIAKGSSDEAEPPSEQIQLTEYTHMSAEPSYELSEADELYVDDEQDGEAEDERVDFYDSACSRGGKPEFSCDELRELISILVTVPEDKLPPAPSGIPDTLEIRRYHYLDQCYALMCSKARGGHDARKNYLKKIMSNDTKG